MQFFTNTARAIGALCALAAVGGCGADELFRQVDRRAQPAPSPDGGALGDDAGGASADGGPFAPDAGASDGGNGAAGDGGLYTDAGAVESIEDYLPDNCEADQEAAWSADVPFGDERGHALVPGGTGFGVAYRAVDSCDHIMGAFVASTGPIPSGQRLAGDGNCTVYRDLSLLRTDDRWWLSWVDNLSGSAEVRAQSFSADMLSAEPAVRLTDNTESERSPAMAHTAAGPLIVWAEGDQEQAIMVHALAEASSESRPIVAADEGHRPTRLAIARMGGDEAAAVAWVNEEGNRGIWLQALTADASPMGEPVELTGLASAGSTLDMATRTRGGDVELGGAVVYSVITAEDTEQVRFRRLSREGRPTAVERTLVGRPARAVDASITELGDGYVVAYRARPDGGEVLQPEIRLLYVTREGSVAKTPAGRPITHRVADAAMTGGRVSVRASIEGQLLISWLDIDAATGASVLRMVRRRLDCG